MINILKLTGYVMHQQV